MHSRLGWCAVLGLAVLVACAAGATDGGIVPGDAGGPGGDAGTALDASPGDDTAIGSDAAGDERIAEASDGTVDPGDGAGEDTGLDAPVVEAGCDASTAAHIPPTGVDSFQPTVNPHWAKTGSADINTTLLGYALLTPDTASVSGALWWNASYTFDHFDVSFTFQIDNKSNGADGMAFAWEPGNDVTKLGGGGTQYGAGGLGGWAVAIDTYQNDGEPAAPFLTVMNSAGTQLTHVAIPSTVRDGTGHTMRILLQTPNVSVWINGTEYLSAFPIPGYSPFAGHWGFTAATGGQSERHFVTAISMAFPDGQGCVP